MDEFIRLIAAAMTAANAVVWAVASRWERPGRDLRMRATLRVPRVVRWCSGPLQAIPFAFPALVAIAPSWTYTGPLNWPPIPILTAVGALAWAAGLGLLLWAESVMREYAAVNGATVGHRLVTAGPYRRMRHPIYTAMIAIAVGTALMFASWLLAAVAAQSIALHDRKEIGEVLTMTVLLFLELDLTLITRWGLTRSRFVDLRVCSRGWRDWGTRRAF